MGYGGKEEIHELERVRFVAGNYRSLQGLRQIPIGLYLLVLALSSSGWWNIYSAWQPVSSLLVVGLMLGLFWLFGVYYERRFGRTRPNRSGDRRRWSFAVLMLVLVAAIAVDISFRPPASVVGLIVAAWFFIGYRRSGGERIHYVVSAGVLAVSSLTPLTGLVSPEQFFGLVLPAVVGAVTVVNGIVDHVFLVRNMKPLPEEDIDRAV